MLQGWQMGWCFGTEVPCLDAVLWGTCESADHGDSVGETLLQALMACMSMQGSALQGGLASIYPQELSCMRLSRVT